MTTHRIDQNNSYLNSEKDIELQNVANLQAGINLLGRIQQVVERHNGNIQTVVPLIDLAEELQTELRQAEQRHEDQEAVLTGVFRLIFGWKRVKKNENSITGRVNIAASEVLRQLEEENPEEAGQIRGDLELSRKNTLKKVIKKEFSILKHSERTQLHRDKEILESHFVVDPVLNNDQDLEVVDRARRMDAAGILEQQIDLKIEENSREIQAEKLRCTKSTSIGFTQNLAQVVMQTVSVEELIRYRDEGAFPDEVKNRIETRINAKIELGIIKRPKNKNIPNCINSLLGQYINNPFILHRLSQLQEERVQLLQQKTQYSRQKEFGEWRSSSVAQSEHQSHLFGSEMSHMTTNPWMERVTIQSGEDEVVVKLGRTGAFTDFTDTSHNIIDLEAEESSDPAVEAQIQERKKIVIDQALTAFIEHSMEVARDIEDGEASFLLESGCMNYSQMSLLKPGGKEKNMLRDIQWALDQLDDKTVIFDGKCGIDSDGNIHVPHALEDPNDQSNPLTLKTKTTLYNFSVHGKPSGKAREYQNGLNDTAITNGRIRYINYREWLLRNENRDLVGQLDRQWADIEKAYRRHPSDYDIAVKLLTFERMTGSSIGINCKSGKDRTSYLIKTMISETVASNNPQLQRSGRKHLDAQIMKKGVGHFITGLNTGVKALKLQCINVLGLNILERIGMLFLAYNIGT